VCVGWGERREKGLKVGEGSKPNSFQCTTALMFPADANIVFYYSGEKKKKRMRDIYLQSVVGCNG